MMIEHKFTFFYLNGIKCKVIILQQMSSISGWLIYRSLSYTTFIRKGFLTKQKMFCTDYTLHKKNLSVPSNALKSMAVT